MTRSTCTPCRSRDLRDQTLCDQRLRSRMLRISTCLPTKSVDKPARGRIRRGAGRRAAFEAARTKSFGSSAWPWYAQAIHTLANTICGQAASLRGRRSSRRKGAGERHFPGRVPHLRRRGQSLTDQVLDCGMRRLSTCLPTQSVDKPGSSGRDDQGCRSSTVGQRANANTHNMMKFRTGTNIVRITSPNARCAARCGHTDR